VANLGHERTFLKVMQGASTHLATPRPGRVIDLRGARDTARAPSVLADPSGRRARRLRVAGRIVGSLLLLWLCGLVLAGLGLVPVSDVPLAGAFRAAEEPASLEQAPSPRPGSDDLRTARPLSALGDPFPRSGSGTRTGARGHSSTKASGSAGANGDGTRHGGTSRDQGHGGSSPAGHARAHGTAPAAQPSPGSSPATSPGRSPNSAPSSAHGSGHSGTTPAASGSVTTHGQSALPHGSSSTAPGHTRTSITGHGPPA
jgi:hypothetical protein